jgi:hypothetical protein
LEKGGMKALKVTKLRHLHITKNEILPTPTGSKLVMPNQLKNSAMQITFS